MVVDIDSLSAADRAIYDADMARYLKLRLETRTNNLHNMKNAIRGLILAKQKGARDEIIRQRTITMLGTTIGFRLTFELTDDEKTEMSQMIINVRVPIGRLLIHMYERHNLPSHTLCNTVMSAIQYLHEDFPKETELLSGSSVMQKFTKLLSERAEYPNNNEMIDVSDLSGFPAHHNWWPIACIQEKWMGEICCPGRIPLRQLLTGDLRGNCNQSK